jgi:hypothetical protein
MIMDHEDDELIEEIDVYYNGELSDEICVMQYPLKPHDKFYGEHAELSNVLINKDDSTLKINYSIESKMKNFDTQYYENKNFTQSLIGQNIEPNTNYCIGLFKNNILYLNPVSTFTQFRNDFSHMEAIDNSKKRNKDKIMSRKESVSTYDQAAVQFDSKWQNMKFYKKDTIQSYQIYEKFYFDECIKPSKIDFVQEREYLNFFFSNVNKEIIIDKLGERTFTYKELMEQPINIRVEFFLKKLFIVDFNKLKKFCGCEMIKNESFLEVCLKYARILKNKALILKSEIRYDSKSDLIMKRNYVINLLQNQKEGVKRSDIKFLGEGEINSIIGEIAQIQNGFYFFKVKDEKDEISSINNFKNIFEKEIAFWDSINFKKNPNAPITNVVIANLDGQHSKMVVDDEAKTDSKQAKKINGTNKFNIEFIKNTIKSIFNSSKFDCINIETLSEMLFKTFNLDAELEENKELVLISNEAIKSLCYNINNVLFIKDVGDAEASHLRKVLIEFLAMKKTAKKGEIKTHLQLNQVSVPDNLLNRVLKSIGNCNSNLWSLKESNK